MRGLSAIVTIFILSSCSMTMPHSEMVNGVSYVGSRDSISSQNVEPVAKLNANYAAIMPFGFMRKLDQPKVLYNSDRQWFGETTDGVRQYVEELRKFDIKIMLKPQIWVWRGDFTGDIMMHSEEDWLELENSYSRFILEYAQLAEELNIEIFCIGTELEDFVMNRPEYWDQLIKQIDERFSGELTYAANWDEFKRIPFWDRLDFIGVDAYFPLSESRTPTVEECRAGWQDHKMLLKEFSRKHGKKVLFTEFGYRSTDFAAREPWDSNYDNNIVNLDAQTNATQAIFDEFWGESWFAGGFVWKWFHKQNRINGLTNSRFTPQNKPAEEVIRSSFARYN